MLTRQISDKIFECNNKIIVLLLKTPRQIIFTIKNRKIQYENYNEKSPCELDIYVFVYVYFNITLYIDL